VRRLLHALCSDKGRASRREFWTALAVAGVVMLALRGVLEILDELSLPSALTGLLGSLVVIIILAWSLIGICTRRLHDIGCSLWHATVPVTIAALLCLPALVLIGQLNLRPNSWGASSSGAAPDPLLDPTCDVALISLLVGAAHLVWVVIRLGCTPGQSGSNRFGAAPVTLAIQINQREFGNRRDGLFSRVEQLRSSKTY